MTLQRFTARLQSAMTLVDAGQVDTFVRILRQAHEEGRTVFVIGNGGSAANASHFSQDLSKGTLVDRGGRRLRAISLVDNVSWMTAIANDEDYRNIFEQQLVTLASPDDVLVAISGSGNSENILRAVEAAARLGVTTVGVTGFDGGRLARLADHVVMVPAHDMGLVESVHACVFHYVIAVLRQAFAESALHVGVTANQTVA